MRVRLGRTPAQQVSNFSAWVHPNNGTIETTYIILLRLVLVGAHHLTYVRATCVRCSSLAVGVADWEMYRWSRGSNTGAGLGSGGPLLRYRVIGPPSLNLTLRLLLGLFSSAVIPQAIGVGNAVLHGYLGNNVAAMGRSLVIITIHPPW